MRRSYIMNTKESPITRFPIYRFIFKKSDLTQQELDHLLSHKTINLTLIKNYNSFRKFRYLILPTRENQNELIVNISKKILPYTIYIDFLLIDLIKKSLYELNQENLKIILQTGNVDTVFCGGVIDHCKINKRIALNTEKDFFGQNVSLRKWVFEKTGLRLPKNRDCDVEINFDLDINKPFVLFDKRYISDLYKTAQKIENGNLKNLILSEYYNSLINVDVFKFRNTVEKS